MNRSTNVWPALVFFAGVGLTVLLMATGLPFRQTSPEGQLATLVLYVLNPPVLLVVYAAPHVAPEPGMSVWPQLQYPITVVVSVLWWAFVRWLLKLGLQVRVSRRKPSDTP